MNWKRLKERFPNSYEEIREFNKKNNIEGRKLFDDFLKTKGYNKSLVFIYNLKDYENRKTDI